MEVVTSSKGFFLFILTLQVVIFISEIFARLCLSLVAIINPFFSIPAIIISFSPILHSII